jgi:hypothetical protein
MVRVRPSRLLVALQPSAVGKSTPALWMKRVQFNAGETMALDSLNRLLVTLLV